MKIKQLLKKITFITFFFAPNIIIAQLGVNSDNSAPHTSSMLDVKSATKGVLIPRVGSDLASPTEGLLYYNTTGHNFRYYDGTAWQNALFGNQWNVNITDISYSLGRVGVGTTTPVGALNIFNTSAANIYFHNTATGSTISDGFYVGNGSTIDGFIWNKESAPIHIGTNNAERITILGNGNVGIGYGAPSYKLSVNGTIYTDALFSNGFSEIAGTLQVNSSANLLSTVNVNGTLNANGNLAVDGNITTNAGKGIVRSNDANQLAIDEFATPANLVWNLGAGGTTCCIGIGFSTFTAPPSIAFGEITGTITNPSFIAFTIESMTNNSAQIRVTNIGNGNSTATNATMHAMIIGRR
jgi:hypothetical protein